MRRTFTLAGLATAGIFSTGLLAGQLGGPITVSAATKHIRTHQSATTTPGATRTPGRPHADGKVTAVNGNIITVQADNDPAGSTEYTGVTTIVLTNNTTYKGSTTRPSIAAGAYIVAEGTVSSDGKTLTATSVGIGGPGGGHGGHRGPHADGTVTAVSGDTISVKPDSDRAGSTEYTKVTTVLLTSGTTYETGTTRASIVAGAHFDAEGTLSADGTTLTATRVGIRGNKP